MRCLSLKSTDFGVDPISEQRAIAAFVLPPIAFMQAQRRPRANAGDHSSERQHPSKSQKKKTYGKSISRKKNYTVVGTGFEPVNSKAERIYSPRPLATWIPYHRVN